MNPWISIWTAPRATLRGILSGSPGQDLTWIAIVEGLYIGLGSMPQYLWPSQPSEAFIAPQNRWIFAILIPLMGAAMMLTFLYLGAIFVRWTGRWLGGQATTIQIQAAIVWGNVPAIAAYGVSGLAEVLREYLILAVLLSVAGLVLFIWSAIVSCKCLAEAQGFGAWRAFFNYLIATTIMGAVIFLPVLVLVGIATRVFFR